MLEQIITAVSSDFVERGVACTVLFDKQFLETNGSPPRIVVVPTRDKFKTTPQIARPVGTQPGFAGGANPRPLRARLAGADAHIWAIAPKQQRPDEQLDANYAALGALLNQFVASLNRVAAGAWELDSGEVDQRTLVVRYGLVYRLSFTVEIPVTDVPWQQVSGLVGKIEVDMLGADGTTVIAETEIQAP